ncbi:MAG TPA: PAS domain-containing protein [Baekduia sp.]|uniref:PAS domain-containing protein n=1 Tax=Baekduia sp. TaxID=2600305 RepID=UPI002BBDB045|nr:PAS domain-containing protein [Baekduia sp.]HMJ36687.1 PAS domain-containing protein [Baekduia sp.]
MSGLGRRRRVTSDPEGMAEAEFVATVVEELTEPVVSIGSDGLVRSNRRARELHGLPAQPLPRARWAARHRVFGRGAERAFAPEELPLLRALDGEEVTAVEIEIRRPGDSAEVFAVSAHPIRRGRRVVGALSVLHAWSAEEQASGFPYADVLQHAADGIAVMCAVTGAFIYTNDAWSAALGYEPGELAGRHVSTVNAPSDRLPRGIAAEMLETLERGGVWRGEMELRRRDGSTVWWEQVVSRYDDDLGRPAWIVVGRDVGARRAGAAELRDAERRFRMAFDALPVAAALTDEDGRVVAVNDALAALAGVGSEELLGRALEAVAEPLDLEAARALITAGRRGDLSRYRVDARCGPSGAAVVVTTTIVRGVDGRALQAVAVVEPVQASS